MKWAAALGAKMDRGSPGEKQRTVLAKVTVSAILSALVDAEVESRA